MGTSIGRSVPDLTVDCWQRGEENPKPLSPGSFQGSWVVLVFYSRDFSFVSPTELAALAAKSSAFEKESAEIIACSTDSFESHQAWFQSNESLGDVGFPVIADTAHEFSRAFGVLGDDGAAFHATFLIDPDGVIRDIGIHDSEIGRNVDEILRTLQALRSGQPCPADWQPGDAIGGYGEWLSEAFPRLTDLAISKAASGASRTVQVPAGGVVFQQGDEADSFYVVVSGEIEVIRTIVTGEEVLLGKLGPGSVLGEIALFTGSSRTAEARAGADEDAELLAFDWTDFEQLIDYSDDESRKFIRIMEHRRARMPE